MKLKSIKWPGNVMIQTEDHGASRLSRPAAPAFGLKTILVPVDFSDCSAQALQYAIPFAEQFNAGMTLLHILPFQQAVGWDGEVANYGPMMETDLRRAAEKRLAGFIQEAAAAGVPVKTGVRHGVPAMEIVSTAKELDADLIIMSTHGHTSRVHAFIGSVAADVTRLAPCPVLVVRERKRDLVSDEGNPFKPDQVVSGRILA